MSEKAVFQSASMADPQHSPATSKSPSSQLSTNPFLSSQKSLGNQALLQLLTAGVIQAKLRVSQPGDPDEQEADRVADKIVTSTHAPKIYRKCSCESSGTPCAKCQDEETTIHRSPVSTVFGTSPLSIQRAPAASDATNTPDGAAGTPSKPSPTPSKTHPLVVEDDAQSVAPHQMRKSTFIGLLRSETCTAADAVLKSVGHSTESCPYIAKWLAFYEKQSSEHVERAILKYAPETASARNAHQAIGLVVVRVRRATLAWAKTGKVSDLPDDLAAQIPGQGFFGAVQKFASTGFGGALLGFIGGRKSEKSSDGNSHENKDAVDPAISRKSNGNAGAPPAHDANAVRSQLGSGRSLDSRVQSQMSTAFGQDFSTVRIHTDSTATKLSSNLNARAFTIGHDVAFASGEYQPGTPIGDALIAHELAHVVQQGAASHNSATLMPKSAIASPSTEESGASHLENDADLSAVGAVASIWAGAKHGLSEVRQNALPRLRSGLRLQRCAAGSKEVKKPDPTCVAPTREAWKEGVTNAKNDLAAQTALLAQALCPLNITVVAARNTHQDAADPDDYQPTTADAKVVNFDPQLNTKSSHANSKTDRPYSLESNYGYNFRSGSKLFVILGPKALQAASPAVVQRNAEHEFFGASEHTARKGKDDESSADAEIDIWTNDFIHYFHLLGKKARGPQGEDRYFGDSWAKLLQYYDDPKATAPIRNKSIQALSNYYRNPASSSPDAGTKGHPTAPADVKQLFDLWFSLRQADSPDSQFVRDWKAAQASQ
jgi:hypothetical protein